MTREVREELRPLADIIAVLQAEGVSAYDMARAVWLAGWRPETYVLKGASETVALWLKSRRDEHNPGNYPHWLIDCLLGEVRDAAVEGHLPAGAGAKL